MAGVQLSGPGFLRIWTGSLACFPLGLPRVTCIGGQGVFLAGPRRLTSLRWRFVLVYFTARFRSEGMEGGRPGGAKVTGEPARSFPEPPPGPSEGVGGKDFPDDRQRDISVECCA